MYSVEYFLAIVIGSMVYLGIIWITFADFVSILMKIFPFKTPRGYDEIKRVRKSADFKVHKRKWVKIYLSLLFIYIGSYIAATKIFSDFGIGFLVSFWISTICFGIASNIEGKARRNIKV